MEIRDFDKFRIGNDVFMDVNRLSARDHSSYGFMVTAYEMGGSKNDYSNHKVEVRKKDRMVALITYKYSDTEIDEWWRNAEVLYSWTEPAKEQIK